MFKRSVVCVFVWALMMSFTVSHAAAAPNIIFIMADDLGYADVSTPLTNLGDPSDFYETPTLERLATEGMAFTHAYANQNCAPTRSAILSGAYAPRSTNNVYQVNSLNRGGNNTMLVGPPQGLPSGEDAIPTSTITHAETLQTAGYETAYIGKFHVTDSSGDVEAFHGFDVNYGGSSAGGPGDYHANSNQKFGSSIAPGLDAFAQNYTQSYVDNNIKPYANGTSLAQIDALVGTAKHVTDASADAAISFMNANNSGSFFIQYSSHAVHSPIGNSQARDDLLHKYNNKTPGVEDTNESFGALIEGMDQSVARIINYLETTPDPTNPGQTLDENTIVIFYSDNGGRQGQSNNSILKGQKGELTEGGVRVPMIAWSGNPALVDGGTINDTPVMPIDFYKTFANLAGAALPAQTLDGVDLTNVFADVNHDLGRDNIFWHLPGYLDDGARDQFPQTVIRSGDWKLYYNYESQSYELYNIITDPSESTNAVDANPALVDTMANDMLVWIDDVQGPLATMRNKSLTLLVEGKSYANFTTTDHTGGAALEIGVGEEVPLLVGDQIGEGTINGAKTFNSSHTLKVDLAGITPGTGHDKLIVTGTLTLGGTLDVSFIDGFNAIAGDSYDILDWGSRSGSFSTINLPTLDSHLVWNTDSLLVDGTISVESTSLPGDLDHDGFVGLGDLDIILNNWNLSVTPRSGHPADPNGDGFVGLADLDIVLNNWNSGTPPATTNIPEPGTAMVVGVAAISCVLRRRSK